MPVKNERKVLKNFNTRYLMPISSPLKLYHFQAFIVWDTVPETILGKEGLNEINMNSYCNILIFYHCTVLTITVISVKIIFKL
jgi:hypothetical protein